MAMTTASSTLSSFSSLSLHTSPRLSLLPFTAANTSLTKLKSPISLFLSSSPRLTTTTCNAEQPEIETTFFDNEDPEYEAVFEPPEAPEGFVPPPSFDEGSLETEDEVAEAYEELYGPAYSGMSVLGNDIYVMDAKVKKLGAFGKLKKEKIRDGFEERVVQVRRVTKVVKGGKQLHFRAVVVVGDKQGNVGVGVGKAKEVIGAVQKSAVNARRNIITVPMTKYLTFPHRVVEVRRVTKVVKGGKQLHFRVIVVVGDKRGCVGVGVGKAKEVIDGVQKAAVNARRNIVTVPMTKYLTFPHRSEGDYGAAKVMLRPASPGTGVIAGGSVRIVLEMAGVENALGKQLGSKNALNNARATVVAVQKMRQFREVALDRGIPMEELWK